MSRFRSRRSSASIATLEAELDVKLLDRRRFPGGADTAAGARLLEAGKNILQSCNGCVSKLLSSFRRTSGHAAIEVVDGSCEQLVEFLADQELDTVLTIVGGNDLNFASRVLFEEPYMLAVPIDHRFARRKSVKLADLGGEPFIVRTRCDFYQDVTNVLVARGIKACRVSN